MALPEPGALTRSCFLSPLGGVALPAGFLFSVLRELGKTEGKSARSVPLHFPGGPTFPDAPAPGWSPALPSSSPGSGGFLWEEQDREEEHKVSSSCRPPPQLSAFYGCERQGSPRDLPLHPRSPNFLTPPSTSCGTEGFPTLGKSHFLCLLTFGG